MAQPLAHTTRPRDPDEETALTRMGGVATEHGGTAPRSLPGLRRGQPS